MRLKEELIVPHIATVSDDELTEFFSGLNVIDPILEPDETLEKSIIKKDRFGKHF